jgi:Alpha/beta hydrolase domain
MGRNIMNRYAACALSGVALLGWPIGASSIAQAHVTQIIVQSNALAFGGYSFPGVGTYQVIKGYAIDAVDPADPQNAVITDIQLAPRDMNGKVEVVFNFYILKPANGNGKMMYEPPNRSSKTFGTMNNTPTAGNDPAAITDAATLMNSFLWPQGYTTVWSGWEYYGDPTSGYTTDPTKISLPASAAGVVTPISNVNMPTTLTTMPVAYGPGNTPITGPGYEYIVETTNTATYALGGVSTPSYPASPCSNSNGKLTHRVHLDDSPQVILNWQYANASCDTIELTTSGPSSTYTACKLGVGACFVQQDIYEFSYTAKNPTVNGLGLAVIRDFNSFLRYSTADDFGNSNPLANTIQLIYTYTLSQPARTLNDFVYLGFNEDESSRIVFDGMLQWVGAGDGLNMNYRWSQTSRTERNRQHELYLEGLYPFANVPAHDPISQTNDWRYRRCEQTNTCPLALEFYSANEYWVKAASLMSTDPTGQHDLSDHRLSRLYLLSSAQHASAGNPAVKGVCQQFQNPLDPAPVERALWMDLDQWAAMGTKPPDSAIPRLSDGTLVPPMPQSSVGFPLIPGVTYTGLKTTRYRFNYGPNFYRTLIPTINPPVIIDPYEDNTANGPIYPSYVPKTDSDGNDIAGIRLPELQVPLATYTGWALRSGVWANDGCEGTGQYIPFAATQSGRLATGDQRLSVQERYASYAVYMNAVVAAVDSLVGGRFLICDDTQDIISRLLTAGLAAGVPPNTQNLSPPNPIPACSTQPTRRNYHYNYSFADLDKE